MRRSQKFAATALAGTLLATALGVAGAAAEGTLVTLEVTGGDLSLDVTGTSPATTLTSGGAGSFSLTDQTYSGSLPATTVTDERGVALATWAVSVTSDGDFVGGTNGGSIPAANAKAYLGVDAATLEGTATGMTITTVETAATLKNLGTAYDLVAGAVVDATSLLGLSSSPSVTFTPQMSVTVPKGTQADTYTMTVTQTAS